MARRRRRPAASSPIRSGERGADQEQSVQRRLRRPSKGHAAKRARTVVEGPRRRTRGEAHHPDAQLELGIGETDGLAELDEVLFVAPRTSEVVALEPVVDPQRELAVVTRLMRTPLPAVELEWMPGEWLDIRAFGSAPLVLYCHPGAEPDMPPLRGWSEEDEEDEEDEQELGPGAAQRMAFAEHGLELSSMNHRVVGVSSQGAARQLSLATDEALPHVLLSDDRFELAEEMGLPTFEVDGVCLYERVTLIVRDGRVEKVFYPVPDPATHAAEVAEWLREGGV